jgi:hypothetical protein
MKRNGGKVLQVRAGGGAGWLRDMPQANAEHDLQDNETTGLRGGLEELERAVSGTLSIVRRLLEARQGYTQ